MWILLTNPSEVMEASFNLCSNQCSSDSEVECLPFQTSNYPKSKQKAFYFELIDSEFCILTSSAHKNCWFAY